MGLFGRGKSASIPSAPPQEEWSRPIRPIAPPQQVQAPVASTPKKVVQPKVEEPVVEEELVEEVEEETNQAEENTKEGSVVEEENSQQQEEPPELTEESIRQYLALIFQELDKIKYHLRLV